MSNISAIFLQHNFTNPTVTQYRFNYVIIENCILQRDIKKRYLWAHWVKIYEKNFATSPCYHLIKRYVCLGACTY